MLSDWSRNSASRSYTVVNIFLKRLDAACALRVTYSLEDLFAPDILQPRVQVLNPLDQRLDMGLVCALNPTCLSNSHIYCELDRAVNAAAQPASTLNVLRGHANAVLSGVGGGEGEFALARTALSDNAVVVVEGLLNGNEDACVWLRLERLGRIVPYFGVIVSYMPSALL